MNNKIDGIEEILRKEMLCHGAISLANYMKICLTHHKHGYYIRNNPIGVAGDFTTSPEISQMFGELIGLWIAQTWIDHQKPRKFSLVELGPGNGTLMADILRATKMVEGLHSALDIILIEISPFLQKVQKKILKNFPVTWKPEIKNLPTQMTIIVANEFFDALPINQYRRKSGQWMEVMVTLKDLNKLASKDFCFQLMKTDKKILTDLKIEEGGTVEISTVMRDVIHYLSSHIQENSGAALIIDYGKEGNVGDTLQAVYKHMYSNPLTSPGQKDLTSFVDFKAIKTYAEETGAIVSNLTNQGDFLISLGIEERAEILSRGLTSNALKLHKSGLDRLINKDAMGNLFKVLGIRNENSPPLIGLDT